MTMTEILAPGGLRDGRKFVVLEWLVDEGADVAAGSDLSLLASEHGVAIVRSDCAGVLDEILVDPGNQVDPAEPIARLTKRGAG